MHTHLKNLLEEARSTFHFSGYQLHWAFPFSSGAVFGGQTSYFEPQSLVEENTLFDIGSITKVFTASLVARKVEAKKWSLDEKWFEILRRERRDISVPAKSYFYDLKLKELLRHSSGLVDWLPIYKDSLGMEPTALWHWFQKNENKIVCYAKNTKALYSDLNFLLIGLLFPDLKKEMEIEIFNFLNLSLQFGPIKDLSRVAATEYSLEENRLIHGEVFDENSRSMGGIAAHAGIFSSAKNLAKFAQEWLKALRGESHWLSEATAKAMVFRTSEIPDSDFALGFDLKSSENSSCGTLMSMETFGHLGYPGCSLWIDPTENGYIIFLTNRIHLSRLDTRIRSLRPKIHDAILRQKK